MKHASAHRCLAFWCLCAAAHLVPAIAQADVTGPGGKTIDCYCTDKQGDRVELGETICLQVDGRMFMAQCQMSLNVPMWRKVQDGCLSARNKPQTTLRARQSQKPRMSSQPSAAISG